MVDGSVRMVKRFLHFLHKYICDISFFSFRVPDFMMYFGDEKFGHLGGLKTSKLSKGDSTVFFFGFGLAFVNDFDMRL